MANVEDGAEGAHGGAVMPGLAEIGYQSGRGRGDKGLAQAKDHAGEHQNYKTGEMRNEGKGYGA